MSRVYALKVKTQQQRNEALQVVEEVFVKEKKWITSIEDQIPEDIAENWKYTWFLARHNENPAGVLRLFYDPPLKLPEEFEVTLREDIDLEKMAEMYRFVEIGRFMILPKYRRNIRVAMRLMRMAIKEVIERDYTHFVTDVYENEVHSPLQFHTRILGFEVVGKHLYGDLNCSSTRIILTLDILRAYKRLKERRSKIYRELTFGIRGILDKKLSNLEPVQ